MEPQETHTASGLEHAPRPANGEWRRLLGATYALTVFASAFLLFQVQPLISKYILPWFGGTPAVWTTCMLFFQVTLFAGYAYAHFAAEKLPARGQALIHLALLAIGWAVLPIVPDSAWKPTGPEQPTWRIVSLLTVSVGLPFFILSTTGPLLQHWFSRTHAGKSPYRLYALSNAGSLLALLSYPFVFEPAWSTTMQAQIWSWGFVGFAGLCALCAVGVASGGAASGEAASAAAIPAVDATAVSPPRRLSFGLYALWFFLAMVPSVLLLAMTNQVCIDVASVPFLWVIPLSLYLLSFILCFDSDRWYTRRIYIPTALVLSGCVVAAMIAGAGVKIWLQVLVHFGALFACAMVCHGELVRLKPDPKHLTAFYLVISAGGAAGGLFAGVMAPLVFPMYLELHFGIVAFAILCVVVLLRDQADPWSADWMRPFRGKSGAGLSLALLATGALAGSLGIHGYEEVTRAIAISRNFYGVLRVVEKQRDDPQEHVRELLHGRILHGLQYVDAEKSRIPTTYYSHGSGIGRILDHWIYERPLRVGLVGLGAGTLASYAAPGDVFRFYDINPEVVRLAREQFTYLRDCRGEVQIALGDARLSLERESDQQFDVLALDAFSSDAIPIHLLTVEAFEIYLRHLKPHGVVAVHISNRHFDLRPVVAALADQFNLASAVVESDDDDDGASVSVWALLARDLEILTVGNILEDAEKPDDRRILWTDDRSNLFEVLRAISSGDSDD